MNRRDVTGAMGEALTELRKRAISADAERAVLVYIDLVVDRLPKDAPGSEVPQHGAS